MDVSKDVYECIKPVEYGRIKYSPDSQVEKSRLIKLPIGTPIDKVISTCFKRQGSVTVKVKPEEATKMEKDAVVKSLDVPVEGQKPEETVESMRQKFADEGIACDNRWNLDTLKEEFEFALEEKKEKEAEGNEE